jgi:hypothetical protein
MLVLILIMIFVFLISSGSNVKEQFVEMFGFAGYKKTKEIDLDIRAPHLDGFIQSGGQITPDEIQSVVIPCQKYFGEKAGVCVYPIETNDVKKYTKNETGDVMFVARFMFTVTDPGFPRGVGATFHVLNGRVIGAVTQQKMDNNDINAYNSQDSQYVKYDSIVADQRKVILNKK